MILLFPATAVTNIGRVIAGRQTSSQNGPLGYYSEGKIKSFVRIISIMMLSVLPILSIIALYFIQSQIVRLGCIVLFSAFLFDHLGPN
jgi:hypothetical protein